MKRRTVKKDKFLVQCSLTKLKSNEATNKVLTLIIKYLNNVYILYRVVIRRKKINTSKLQHTSKNTV